MLTELGRSQVEASGAQCAQTLAVEVQQWPLRAEVGEELGKELARRKWTWKWRQSGGGGERGGGEGGGEE